MKNNLDIEIYLSLIIAIIIGVLFGAGITDWGRELEKDSFTDWIMAICTVLIAVGTILATFYTKRSLYFSKKSLYANNLDKLSKFDKEVLCVLRDTIWKYRDFRKELRNFIFNKYDHITTFINIIECSDMAADLNQVLKAIEENMDGIYFIINDPEVVTLNARINMLILEYSALSYYEVDDVKQNIDKMKCKFRTILQRFDELEHSLNDVSKILDEIYRY